MFSATSVKQDEVDQTQTENDLNTHISNIQKKCSKILIIMTFDLFWRDKINIKKIKGSGWKIDKNNLTTIYIF